jgi:hypothetical protein
LRSLGDASDIGAARSRHSRRSATPLVVMRDANLTWFGVAVPAARKLLEARSLDMNAVSFQVFEEADDVEESPPTTRAPASGIARLVARMHPDGPDAIDDTLPRAPTLDLLAAAAGVYDIDAIAAMREHYAREEMTEALAIAAHVRDVCAALDEAIIAGIRLAPNGTTCPAGGGPSASALVVTDADIAAIDDASFAFDEPAVPRRERAARLSSPTPTSPRSFDEPGSATP